MESKDPRDMTASELLRWAANGEPDELGRKAPVPKLFGALDGDSYGETSRSGLRSFADKIAGARPSERCGVDSCGGARGADLGRRRVALYIRGGGRCGEGSPSCNRCGHLRRDEGLGTVWFSRGRRALFCAHPEGAARRIAATGWPHRFIGWSRPGGGLDAKTVPGWCPLRGRR